MMRKFLAMASAAFFSLGVCAGDFNITVTGRISDTSGRPVQGVPVTDGCNIVRTDIKGDYVLNSTTGAGYIYYTLPSGYDHVSHDRCIPQFYKEIDKTEAVQRADFILRPAAGDQERHVLLVWADPQVYLKEEFSQLDEVVADMNSVIKDCDVPVLAMSAGDNVFDKPELIEDYKDCIAPLGIPFYHVLGNHDLDYNGRSDKSSDRTYSRNFGPSHYSFNVGKVHYVVLKDVFYYGDRYLYMGYVTEKQLSWLEQDLAGVGKGSTVVLGVHIPTVYGDSPEPSEISLIRNSVLNRQALYRILDGYNVHIMAGHSHIQWNTIVSDNIMEHTHGAASGAWWQGEVGLDGNPKGYTVYEIDGDDVSWYFKGVGHDRDDQFKLYIEGDTVIANVYNHDPLWKVELFEDGRPLGDMEQYWGVDPYAESIYPPGGCKVYPWLSYGQTSHLFRGRISDPEAYVRVVVTDRFGNVYEKSAGGKQ